MSRRLTAIIIGLLAPLFLSSASDVYTEHISQEPDFRGAQWIGAPWETDTYVFEKAGRAPVLKKEFTLDSKVQAARIKISGLGFFELYVNGQRVGDDVLTPVETSYSHRPNLDRKGISVPVNGDNFTSYRVAFLEYNLKPYLKKGTNTIQVILGNGFYAIGGIRWVEPYGSPRLLCKLDISLKGAKEPVSIVSDTTWHAAKTPIVQNHLFYGEIYDARLEDDLSWEPVCLRSSPDGRLVPQEPGTGDKIIRNLKPQSITRLQDGRYEVDFGEYITGWVRLSGINAPAGNEISLDFPVEPMYIQRPCEYKYICSGKKNEQYAPRFVWWAFSKAVVSGWQGELLPENITAQEVHSDVPVTGHFECSNQLFNTINQMYVRTQLDNMHLGVATDCPHREKGPYTGDGQVSCVSAMHNLGVEAFYRKWLRDMADCQDSQTGYVPNGAPWHPGCGGGVAWGAAMNIIPWEHYLHYADLSVLQENYNAMAFQVEHMCRWIEPDGTMYQKLPLADAPLYWMNLGEWCPSYSLASERLVHTYYLYKCADITAKTAQILGKEQDALRFSALAKATSEAFHTQFWDPVAKTYGAGSGKVDANGYGTGMGGGLGDGSNIFALDMGVPQERYQMVIDRIRQELEANSGHLNTGIFGTALFFEVLCNNGLAQEAFQAMNKTDYPSYGWWVEQGADTFWEQWNGADSHNHPMFGGGLVWLYRCLCGLNTDPQEPGYKHMIVRPQAVGDVTWAKYSTQTKYGTAAVEWKFDSKSKMSLKVIVPKGCHATVYLPGEETPRKVGSGTHRF